MARDGPALRRDELAPAEMQAMPSLAGQFHVTHQAQQLVDRIRHLMATA